MPRVASECESETGALGDRDSVGREVEDDHAAIPLVLRLLRLPRARLRLGELELRLLVPRALFLFSFPDLLDDEGRQHRDPPQ
jgi:hypothetical protein